SHLVIMEIRGRKKFVAKLTPLTRDPRDVKTIKRLQQRIQELEFQHDSPVKEAKTEPNIATIDITMILFALWIEDRDP
nr:hypothetical protein [Tanacetum cinerariifolium]